MEVKMKLCCVCEEVKPETSEFFYRRSSNEGGFRCDCKLCRKTKRKKNYNKPTKICTKCKKEYPNTGIYFNNLDGVICKTRAICRNCHKATMMRVHYKRTYNITTEQYNSMVLEQKNKCIICNNTPKKLVVDHNHSTGKVRGLLCSNCNTGIGMFKENIETMKKAISYMETHN